MWRTPATADTVHVTLYPRWTGAPDRPSESVQTKLRLSESAGAVVHLGTEGFSSQKQLPGPEPTRQIALGLPGCFVDPVGTDASRHETKADSAIAVSMSASRIDCGESWRRCDNRRRSNTTSVLA